MVKVQCGLPLCSAVRLALPEMFLISPEAMPPGLEASLEGRQQVIGRAEPFRAAERQAALSC